MKTFKKLCLVVTIAVATILSSCTPTESDSTASSGSSSGPFPSKVIYNRSSQILTHNYTYSGNKIVEINTPESDVRKVKFTYTGDNITKIENFFVNSNTPSGGLVMTYENGKLKTKTDLPTSGNNNQLDRENRVYNADGTVDITFSKVNQSTGVETPNTNVRARLTYTNGFLTREETIYTSGTTQVTNYTIAQGKNAAFKNVLGYAEFTIFGNLITNEEVVGSPTVNYSYTYTFNAQNYPTKVVSYNGIFIDITY